jgi:hypothetical protein
MIKPQVTTCFVFLMIALGTHAQSFESMKYSWNKITTPAIDFKIPMYEHERKSGGLHEYTSCFANSRIDSSWYYHGKGINLRSDVCIAWGAVDLSMADGVMMERLASDKKSLLSDSLFTVINSRITKSNGSTSFLTVYAPTERARNENIQLRLTTLTKIYGNCIVIISLTDSNDKKPIETEFFMKNMVFKMDP